MTAHRFCAGRLAAPLHARPRGPDPHRSPRPTSILTASIALGALAAFAASVLATRLTRALAVRHGHVDVPDARKRHALAVPRLGGVGIAAGVVAGLVAASAFGGVALPDVLPLLVGAAVITGLGLWDDLRGLGFKRRFVVQTAAAYGMVLAGWHVDVSNLPVLGALGPFEQAAVALPLTLLWTVGLCNAMNLIDGLDGLAGGVAVVAFGALGVAYAGDGMLLALCVVGAAATAGFLVFNVHPASIFMGDTGSTLLGFLLAMGGLRGVDGAPTLGLLAVPVVALGLPVLDTLTTMARRVSRRQSPFLPDADHIHHRVLERSHSVHGAVRALWGAGAVFGAIAVVLSRAQGSNTVQALCVLASVAFGYLVVRRLRYVRARVLWRRLQRQQMHRRRARAVVAVAPSLVAPVGGDGAAGAGRSAPPTVADAEA